MTAFLKIGSPGGDGPYISDYGPMTISGDNVTIKLWDGWPEKEISFNMRDRAESAAALARCKQMRAEMDAKWDALPRWRKTWERWRWQWR